VLSGIAKDKGVAVSDNALAKIAANASGDLRSAVRDLQALATGSGSIPDASVATMGRRDMETTMYEVMDAIFQGEPGGARVKLREVDEPPDTKILWIDENLPSAYRDPFDLYRGMSALASASSFLGRTYRRQYFGLWAYAGDMMSFGVSAARKGRAFRGRYSFPSYLMRMSRSKGQRALQLEVARRVGSLSHLSARQARTDLLPYFSEICRNDHEFMLAMTSQLALEEEEAALILGDTVDSSYVKKLMAQVKKGEQPPERAKSAKGKKAAPQKTLF